MLREVSAFTKSPNGNRMEHSSAIPEVIRCGDTQSPGVANPPSPSHTQGNHFGLLHWGESDSFLHSHVFSLSLFFPPKTVSDSLARSLR